MFYLKQGDCLDVIPKLVAEGIVVDGVITSPPYNMTKRKGGWSDKKHRYDVYRDDKDYNEYLEWSVNLFNQYHNILKENGTILYNFSYSIENPTFPYILVNKIYEETKFCVADTIIWKKPNSMPYPASPNRLQRICEFIFVFVRKSELQTFETNKKVSKVSETGQKYYKPVPNFIEAKNNDGKCELNEATFSTELVDQLIQIYFKPGQTIMDNFSGTGTTMVSCKNNKLNGVGIELSQEQIEYTKNRLKDIREDW